MPARALLHQNRPAQKIPWRLLLQISGRSHTTIGLDVKEQILLGRRDAHSGTQPDLDLVPYGAETLGVSRRHAQIIAHEQALYLQDLNSTNGTRLNGFTLEAEQGYRLHNGDEIELGQLKIVLRFVKSMLGAAPSQTE